MMKSKILFFGIFLCLLALSLIEDTLHSEEEKVAVSSKKFPKQINQFLSTHCISCHGPKKQKGKVRLDTLNQDLINGPHAEDWHDVLDMLNKGEMPPEDEDQPSTDEHDKVVEFLTEAFEKAEKQARSTGGRVVLRRLTNYEYDNTLNDLLALDTNFSKDFPPDSFSKEGFKNNGSYMGMSALQMENYLEMAAKALDMAIHIGDRPTLLTSAHANEQKVDKKNQRKKKKVKVKKAENALYWKGLPREGKIAVDIKLAHKKDLKNVEAKFKLSIGYRIDGKSHLFKDVEVKPVLLQDKAPYSFRYIINITDYPQPAKVSKYSDQIFKLSMTDEFKLLSISAQGPYFESWPPRSHNKVFIESSNKSDESLYAREIIDSFMQRAWRRPVSQSESEIIFKAYKRSRLTSDFVKSIKNCLVRVLVSPDFIYLLEPRSQSNSKETVSAYEFANRLSYFLWSSMPDDKLFENAGNNKLREPADIRAEVRRMLKDKKSLNFVKQFTTQWLELDKMDSVAVNPEYYPQFDNDLKQDMKNETLQFFSYILHENKSALNFLDSNFTFVNDRLSKHYKLKSQSNSYDFERVALHKDDHRGGLLTQGSMHLANSNGADSHVIYRGVWLIDRLLGNPPPSPPANVPEIDETVKGFAKMSLKEQLARHVSDKACARCHKNFDPYGIAFENFDAVGAWRHQVKKIDHKKLVDYLYVDVDASSKLSDSTRINGISDLKKYLLEHKKEEFAENIVRRLLTYGLGRSLEFGDRGIVRQLKSQFIKNNYKLATLIEDIVLCELWQKK